MSDNGVEAMRVAMNNCDSVDPRSAKEADGGIVAVDDRISMVKVDFLSNDWNTLISGGLGDPEKAHMNITHISDEDGFDNHIDTGRDRANEGDDWVNSE